MTDINLQQTQHDRFKVLRLVYDLSGHNQTTLITLAELGKQAGFPSRELNGIINYLSGENLIGSYTISTVSITHKGIVEVEKALSKPESPTEYFPAINIIVDKEKTSSSKGIVIALISLVGVVFTAIVGFLGVQYQTQTPIQATQSAIVQTATLAITSVISDTPSPSPIAPTTTPLPPKKTAISKNQWCVFIVPEDKDMTIRSVIVLFLQEGQIAEDFRENVYEATSGVIWHDVWYEDLWDYRTLPKDTLEIGTIVPARVGLGFINYIEDCVGNGGKIYDRPPTP